MSFTVNKIIGGLLTAMILGVVLGLISHVVIPTPKLEKAAYPIVATEAPAAEAEAPANDKPTPIPADLWAKADPAQGEKIVKQCGLCHTWDKDGKTKIGPNLYGVVGRARASIAGFNYSDAVKGLGGSWGPQDIAAFIFKPSLYAPGTKMTFAGLPKAEDRANVIAFLNKQSDAPVDLTK